MLGAQRGSWPAVHQRLIGGEPGDHRVGGSRDAALIGAISKLYDRWAPLDTPPMYLPCPWSVAFVSSGSVTGSIQHVGDEVTGVDRAGEPQRSRPTEPHDQVATVLTGMTLRSLASGPRLPFGHTETMDGPGKMFVAVTLKYHCLKHLLGCCALSAYWCHSTCAFGASVASRRVLDRCGGSVYKRSPRRRSSQRRRRAHVDCTAVLERRSGRRRAILQMTQVWHGVAGAEARFDVVAPPWPAGVARIHPGDSVSVTVRLRTTAEAPTVADRRTGRGASTASAPPACPVGFRPQVWASETGARLAGRQTHFLAPRSRRISTRQRASAAES